MSPTLVALLVVGALFLALDFVWLGTMTKRLYRPQLGSLMREKIAIAPAVAFYFIYVVVLTMLVVVPAAAAGDAGTALRNGLLLGFGAYATYDLTNAATLKGWPPLLTLVDLAWGTVATGVAAFLAVTLLNSF